MIDRMQLPLQKFQYKQTGYFFLWAFLAIQAVGFILSVIPGVSGNLLVVAVVNNIALLAVYFVYSIVSGVQPWKAGKINAKFDWWMVIVAIIVAPLLQNILYGSLGLFDLLLTSNGYHSINSLVGLDYMEYGVGGLIGYILICGVLTGIAEELIFRGAILQSLRTKMGDTAAVFACAGLFMIFHGSPDQTIFQFGLGLTLGLLTVRSGSIIPAIVLHAVSNIFAIVMDAVGWSWWLPEGIGGLIGYAIGGLIVFAIVIPLLIDLASRNLKSNWMVRVVDRLKHQPSVDQKEGVYQVEPTKNGKESTAEELYEKTQNRMSTILLWVGVVFCVAIWIAGLVLGLTAEVV